MNESNEEMNLAFFNAEELLLNGCDAGHPRFVSDSQALPVPYAL
jgi:hypothetical protein